MKEATLPLLTTEQIKERYPHIENGRINSTMLGNASDHGIFTWAIDMGFDGTGQYYISRVMDMPVFDGIPVHANDKRGTFQGRTGTARGLTAIMGLLKCLEVQTWEKLPGTHVRVARDERYGTIKAVGHIIKDQWFDDSEYFKPAPTHG